MNPDKKNEFERQLAGKFENFHPSVPNGLWDKIASRLDEQEQNNSVSIKQRRRLPTWWISVAASVLVVCGIVFWYNRPVAVTYLQNPGVHAEKPNAPAVEKPATAPTPEVEPLDIDRLKQLFAKRNRKPRSEDHQETRGTGTPVSDQTVDADHQQVIVEDAVPPMQALAKNDEPAIPVAEEQPTMGEVIAATVPAIQPPVVLEEEETLLAATEEPKQPFGVSNILNYVVGAVDQREEKLVTFSNDGEGSLKLDFNFSLAKNKKKRVK